MPKFRDITSWQQAEIVMQPAFIRLVDNIRKQLEQSEWSGHYSETLIWPPEASEEAKFKVEQLQTELQAAAPERAEEIEQALADLPTPFPKYHLSLKRQEQEVTVDLWNLCYQICFQNYHSAPDPASASDPTEPDWVEVDTSLFDGTGDVDWNRLDAKTRAVVEAVFANLPG